MDIVRVAADSRVDERPSSLAAQLAEDMAPGAELAEWLSVVDPAEVGRYHLPGVAAAWRRLAAWAQARELAAVAEMTARAAARDSSVPLRPDGLPERVPDGAADEVALALGMSRTGGAWWAELATTLAWRLPGTLAALERGEIDLSRAKLITEATRPLSDENARKVQDKVLAGAGGQTLGQLRAALRQAVISVDKEAAERRREDAERKAKVGLYSDEEGTATLSGQNLPGAQSAAAMARLTAIAKAMKAAGATDSVHLLRAKAFLGLLLGTLPLIPLADGQEPPDPDVPGSDEPGSDPGGNGPSSDPGRGPGGFGPSGSSTASGRPGSSGPRSNEPGSFGPSGSSAASGRPDAPSAHANRPCGAGGQGIWQDEDWPSAPAPDDVEDLSEPGAPAKDADDDDWLDYQPSAPAGGSAPNWNPSWPRLPIPGEAPTPGCAPLAPLGRRQPPSASRTARALHPQGTVRLTATWLTLAGLSSEPGQLCWLGPVTPATAQLLARAAAADPACQWRIILTGPDGRAAAAAPIRAKPTPHPAASPPHQRARAWAPCLISRVTIIVPAELLPGGPLHTTAEAALRAGSGPLTELLRTALRTASHTQPPTPGPCGHHLASHAYRLPPRLREYIEARDQTCRFPTCRQPAWRTDKDHTIPWHKGGPTCSCNTGPECRTHHQLKQQPGWRLNQPTPGTFTWTTPSGRTHTVTPPRLWDPTTCVSPA